VIDGRAGLLRVLRSKFVKDTAWLQTGTFLTVGTYMLTSMLLARSLGPIELGRYDLAQKFYDLCFFVANLGLINVTVVRYSHALGRRSREDQILALAAFGKISLLMAAVILLLGFFACPFAGEEIYGDRQVGVYAWALCLMGLLEILRALAKAVLLGTRAMRDAAFLAPDAPMPSETAMSFQVRKGDRPCNRTLISVFTRHEKHLSGEDAFLFPPSRSSALGGTTRIRREK